MENKRKRMRVKKMEMGKVNEATTTTATTTTPTVANEEKKTAKNWNSYSVN